MDWRTILEDVLQEKLSIKIEQLEVLEVVVERLRKKNRIVILFAGYFLPIKNNILE